MLSQYRPVKRCKRLSYARTPTPSYPLAKKNSAIFTKKKRNLNDSKNRAEFVREIKKAKDDLQPLVQRRARAKGLKIEGHYSDGRYFRLIDFDENDLPVYEHDTNVNAAISTATNEVRDNPTYQQASAQVEAELSYPNNQGGIEVETCTDVGGGQNIGYIENGDWAEYTIDVPTPGSYRLAFRTASNNNNGGTINLSANGTSIGSIVIPDTNNWQAWTTVNTHVVFATSGPKTLRMDFAGGAGYLFNINWFTYNRRITIGLWESGGIPRTTHQEFEGRITIIDGSTSTSNHASHVAGTMIAAGINPEVKGMAPAASIAAFRSGSDKQEMAANGASTPNTADIYISNHSYGSAQGWFNNNGWSWYGTFVDDGDPSTNYEGDFGRYSYDASQWDGIAYNLPYYQIFVAAGNHRGYGPPNQGQQWTYGSNTYTYDATQHPAGNRGYKNGYDNIGAKGMAKNVIAVGAVGDAVTNGVRDTSKAVTVSFSSRGPADDGRIKPDIVANGASLKSSISSSNTATASYSGTSMSSPNACGSAALLIDYYTSRFTGQAMRASTLKALILHTADDRGNAGPDYKYGWGLMNTKEAADVIKLHADDNGGAHMLESSVDTTTTSQTHTFAWNGSSPLRVTLCWTDPASAPKSGHENRGKALVNDLNMKITGPEGTHYPYVMPHVGNWSTNSIEDTATTGVNDVDNIEQVYLSAPASGDYTVTVDYLGPLTDGIQDYSLIVTGQTAAEIEVEHDGPPVNGLADNSGAQDFGATAPSDASVVRSYTIRNTGGNPLTGLSITKGGTHQNDFTVSPLSSSQVATGQMATFTVSYDPLGTGARTAALQLASNDVDENVFDINLAAIGLSELEAWRLANFNTTEGTGNFADNSDYDQDGVLNLT